MRYEDPWVQTFSGRAVSLLAPRAADIDLQDISVALSRINRFSGHTTRPWSVAAHSLLAESLMLAPPDRPFSPEERLIVLLHDAHEAYTGDVTTPMKRAARDADIYIIQNRLDRAIRAAFGLGQQAPDAMVRRFDILALAVEKAHLMAPEPRSWGIDLPDVTGTPLPTISGPDATAYVFEDRCRVLVREAKLSPLSTLNL